MTDVVPVVDAPYINPAIYDIFGHLSVLLPGYIDDVAIVRYLPRIRLLTPVEVVDIITSRPEYVNQVDIIYAAISGMDYRGVGVAMTGFFDKFYPNLMQRLKNDEDTFNFYKDVIIALVERINKDGSIDVN